MKKGDLVEPHIEKSYIQIKNKTHLFTVFITTLDNRIILEYHTWNPDRSNYYHNPDNFKPRTLTVYGYFNDKTVLEYVIKHYRDVDNLGIAIKEVTKKVVKDIKDKKIRKKLWEYIHRAIQEYE